MFMASKRVLLGILLFFTCNFLNEKLPASADNVRSIAHFGHISMKFLVEEVSNGSCRTGHEKLIKKQVNVTDPDKYWFDMWFDDSLEIENCHSACLNHCLCSAYNMMDQNGTPGCLLLGGELQDAEDKSVRYFYVLKSDTNTHERKETRKITVLLVVAQWWWAWVLAVVLPSLAMFYVGRFFYWRSRKDKQEGRDDERLQTRTSNILRSLKKRIRGRRIGNGMQMFSYKSMLDATNQFSDMNRLGGGGFGPVYKGVLPDGQEIAVKRLSKTSKQGVTEFKNEIALISELQHRNLVRLLGCCIHGDEKLLVYEYLPNKSLDVFIFDPSKRVLLQWKKLLEIIEGIAQGLLYLHKHSRLKVIHRDLKTSNILLDGNMNPKISDFGLARIFEQNKSTAHTKRLAGTYGYMPPEYAMQGLFSEKTDVFSFGVIVLEIITGKKNSGFTFSDYPINLIGHVWDLWRDGKIVKLIDKSQMPDCSRDALRRHIHVALLCVQENAKDRPSMSDIVHMLKISKRSLSDPKQPAFCYGRSEELLNVRLPEMSNF